MGQVERELNTTRNYPADELSAVSVLVPGGIEKLVEEQRVPRLIAMAGRDNLWAVPPEGAQFGDEYHPGGIDLGNIEFVSPSGVSRGHATLVLLPATESRSIRSRISEALGKLRG